MEKESAHDIISCTNKAFRFAILRGGVRARKPIDDAIGGEKGAKRGVDEFAAIVTLHSFDDHMKLSVNIGKETLEDSRGLGFVMQRKCPRVMCVVIQDNKIVLKPEKTYNGGGPQITMN